MPETSPRRCATVATLLLAAAGALAQTASRPVALEEALRAAQANAGSVQGAQLDAQAKQLQARALSNINGPAFNLSAFRGRVDTTFNFDVSRVANAVNPVIGAVDQAVPVLSLQPLPQVLSANRAFNLSSLGILADWPLYTGGRLEAARGLAEGRAHEADADVQEARDKTATLTAQRYFSVQLARQGLQVRRAAAADIAEHQRMAQRLETTGLIARAERLKADVALAGARRDAAKAESDAQLAQVALDRHLASPEPVAPTTPLFVHTQSVGSLQSFIELGLASHPAWTRIAAKREQAEQSLRLAGSNHSPTVMGVGNYNLNRSSDKLVQPNWFVGVLVSVPLVGHIDHGRMAEAARLEQQRVETSAAQAQRDVPTLIENNWRAMENARAQFASMDASLQLARENLRLQTASFQHQQATSTDVTDARVNLAKTETERVQAAYEYVMALARLLEACGQPERLAEYAASADIRLPLP